MSETDRLRDYLAQNPRMTGALFAITLVLSQASATVAANGASTGAGP